MIYYFMGYAFSREKARIFVKKQQVFLTVFNKPLESPLYFVRVKTVFL